jgi:hypothetical protein
LGGPSIVEVDPNSVFFRKWFADDDAAVAFFSVELGETLDKIEYSNLWKCCAGLKINIGFEEFASKKALQ